MLFGGGNDRIMTAWEYKIFLIKAGDNYEPILNGIGLAGWELAAAFPVANQNGATTGFYLILKRPSDKPDVTTPPATAEGDFKSPPKGGRRLH